MVNARHDLKTPASFGAHLKVLRGPILAPFADRPGFQLWPDAVLHLSETGVIRSVELDAEGSGVPVTYPGALWMPGFVDTHVHFPQTRIIGSATGELLDWLEESVFPEEMKFASREYAEAVADEFCENLARLGTTTAAVYSASYESATDVLFDAMATHGLRGMVGLTLMDQGAPTELCVPASDAIAAAERLVRRWHGHDDGRLEFCVTPRFALSCSDELLRLAGQLAARHDLPIQTHIAENVREVDEVAAAFPTARNYLHVYERFGLATPRTIFAHCIYLSDDEWDRAAELRCGVSHCPDSNFFLRSGQMNMDAVRTRGVKLGLGSDVGAGRTFSLLKAASSAYDTAGLVGVDVSAEQLLWYATRGGAEVMGLEDKVGLIKPGFQADLIALSVDASSSADLASQYEKLVFQSDREPVLASYVRGRRVWARP